MFPNVFPRCRDSAGRNFRFLRSERFPPGRSKGANRLHKPGGVVSRSGHKLAGIDVFEEEQRGDEPARIVEGWVGELEAFRKVGAKYLLYRWERSIR